MKSEFSGIERRLEKLSECLTKLEPLKTKSFDDFEQDPYLRDIVERNLEVAAQCCIDIANRVISIEDLEKPEDYCAAGSRVRLNYPCGAEPNSSWNPYMIRGI
ncbi:DUF86 domain-containing protein [Neomoorella thermoacetica]|uniref:DUF86 domain-containing protein n=1 Tax=Neomoorella thermoacetica TaxID=1525 RepID=UPI0030CD1948